MHKGDDVMMKKKTMFGLILLFAVVFSLLFLLFKQNSVSSHYYSTLKKSQLDEFLVLYHLDSGTDYTIVKDKELTDSFLKELLLISKNSKLKHSTSNQSNIHSYKIESNSFASTIKMEFKNGDIINVYHNFEPTLDNKPSKELLVSYEREGEVEIDYMMMHSESLSSFFHDVDHAKTKQDVLNLLNNRKE